MTPKEKALEIFNKMCNSVDELLPLDVKQCALITVNEIIDALETYDEKTEEYLNEEFPNYFSFELQNMEQDLRFYQQVKKEIELL